MNSIVLMDCSRLNEVAKGQKSYFMENGERRWELDDNTFKFIVLTDGKLVIGPILDHGVLHAIHAAWDMPIPEAVAYVKAYDKAGGSSAFSRWDCPIVAAGSISWNGKVTAWKSGGFRIETPQGMREEIEREVERLFMAGLLGP